MFNWLFVFLAALFSVPSVFSLNLEDRALLFYQQELIAKLKDDQKNSQAIQELGKIHEFVVRRLAQEDLSFEERSYLQGYAAFEDGKIISARNQWFKYLEYEKKIKPQSQEPRKREVAEFFNKTDSTLNETRIKPFSLPSMESSVEEIQKTHKRRRRKKSLSPSDSLLSSWESKPLSSVDSKKLLKKANRAEEQGQLEYAMRLYSLALKIKPESVEIKNKLEELQKQVN